MIRFSKVLKYLTMWLNTVGPCESTSISMDGEWRQRINSYTDMSRNTF